MVAIDERLIKVDMQGVRLILAQVWGYLLRVFENLPTCKVYAYISTLMTGIIHSLHCAWHAIRGIPRAFQELNVLNAVKQFLSGKLSIFILLQFSFQFIPDKFTKVGDCIRG